MFYYKDITLQTEGVYEPEEDSTLLADTLDKYDINGKQILDMGTGSGLLAIIAAKKGATVVAADIDEQALRTAEKNAMMNNVSVRFVKSDLFANINGKFDLIIFNPPYLPTNEQDGYAKKRLDYDGGKTGCDVIKRFVMECGRYLYKDGRSLMLISSLTGMNDVKKMLEKNGFSFRAIAKKKIEWEELVVIEIQIGGKINAMV